MRRTYVYFISLLAAGISFEGNISAQDTISVPLKIMVGAEVSGSAVYFYDNNSFSAEVYVSADIDEKKSLLLSAGRTNYKYSQYNYEYLSKGSFMRLGLEINLLRPDKAAGRYWAGVGFMYGLSHFQYEVPSFTKENYWGSTSSSVPLKTSWGHFLELSPGVRAEIFRNFSIGWNVSIRMLLYSGADSDLKPINMPGFGNASKFLATGASFFIVWSIPYKKINVILKKEVPEEPEEPQSPDNKANPQKPSGIR